MSEPIIRLENVCYRYPRTKEYVLKNINLEIQKGEFVAIMGENGAGKTTFCQLLTGIIPKEQGGKLKGDVYVCGLNTKQNNLCTITQKVGIVLEDPETQLFTTKVKNEIAFGAENLQKPVNEIQEMVEWALEVVRLKGFEERHPTALSGGQKQRVAIAAALAMKPDILVLDEPTSQLDPIGTLEVFEVIKKLREDYGLTICIATHQSEEIALFADKVAVLHQGEFIAYGTPQEIFQDLETVQKAWIRLPQVSELALYLKDRGLELNGFPILKEEGSQMILNELSKQKRGAAANG
ncbi:MAG: ATP-binding cassette domain-containing protein [Clostridia bacterium]|nr:ATP-binding cassette domain-containing protein [Clostridia bacterium]